MVGARLKLPLTFKQLHATLRASKEEMEEEEEEEETKSSWASTCWMMEKQQLWLLCGPTQQNA